MHEVSHVKNALRLSVSALNAFVTVKFNVANITLNSQYTKYKMLVEYIT